jgi:sigma-B regulation protein RsbU (phosphoserine phosphatase)
MTMNKFQRWHLKNEMMGANFLANFVGVALNKLLLFKVEGSAPEEILQNPVFNFVDMIFTPLAFIFVGTMTVLYEKPIRSFLDAKFNNQSVSTALEHTARQRLLNEPFVLIALSFSMWLLSGIVYPAMHWALGSGTYWMTRSCFQSFGTGLITITVAFFLMEHILQKGLAPHFFPNGGLYTIPKTLRIRIRTRLAALAFACNIIPLLTIFLIIQRIPAVQSEPAKTLGLLHSAISMNVVIFLVSGGLITMLVSRNLTLPFGEIIQTLRGVRNGEFDKKVQVTSNDEIGYTGDVINEMTDGLLERERMRQSLNLAKEVQQHLMPGTDPQVTGLDIAGTSIYCEETGGDYYDYLVRNSGQQGNLGIVVGDVSDHGVPSALLMTTARAFLRQRFSISGNLDQVVSDANQQLSRDVKESGRFMTLFLCEIDRSNAVMQWVNAGHEPAMIFDPNTPEFIELTGGGLPLGVSEKSAYQKFHRNIKSGQILLIGTDGIWESQNSSGEMFGKDRFKNVVQEHFDKSAKQILSAVMGEIDNFSQAHEKADDVTLVVVKVVQD